MRIYLCEIVVAIMIVVVVVIIMIIIIIIIIKVKTKNMLFCLTAAFREEVQQTNDADTFSTIYTQIENTQQSVLRSTVYANIDLDIPLNTVCSYSAIYIYTQYMYIVPR